MPVYVLRLYMPAYVYVQCLCPCRYMSMSYVYILRLYVYVLCLCHIYLDLNFRCGKKSSGWRHLGVLTCRRCTAVRLFATAVLYLRSYSSPGDALGDTERLYYTRTRYAITQAAECVYGIRRRTPREFSACTPPVPRQCQARCAVSITVSVPCMSGFLGQLISEVYRIVGRPPYPR